MKRILLISFVLMSALISEAWAQRTVTGKVTSAAGGEGLPGVTVRAKGTSTGVSTDFDGNYRLSLPEGSDVLVFTFVGFTTQEIPVNNRSVIDVALEEDVKQLEEVVVVGYGTQKRKELTGAVTSVSSKEIADLPVSGVDAALQGRAAGVQVVQNSGTPGGGISVRVRGATSINASNQPLYVVDGIPINSGNYASTEIGGQGLNALSNINPNDIESIEILKDAASASIYGSRAANGVVIITTKKGTRDQKTQFEFGSYYGIQEAWNKIELLDASQYRELLAEALANRFGGEPADMYGTFGDPNEADLETTSWLDEIFRKAPIQNYELSARGGNDKTRFYVSGTYFDQQGIILGSGFDRLNGRINLDHFATDKLSFGTNIGVSRSVTDRIQNDNNIYGVLSASILNRPDAPIYNEDGTYNISDYYGLENPVAAANEYQNDATNFRLLGNIYAQYEIIEGLRFKSNWSTDLLSLTEEVYEPSVLASAAGSNGEARSALTKDDQWISEQTLNYSRLLGDHSLNMLAGASYQESQFNRIIAEGTNFASTELRQVFSAGVKDADGTASSWGLTSYFGRVNYSFNDRYLLSASFRADGSSRFGKANRWGYFPSASAGWVISEESFLEGSEFLDNLKFRASYGITGNQEIDNFEALGLFGSGRNYEENPGIAPTQLENPNLKWETTAQLNVGLDFGIFASRLSGSVDYYNKTTEDLLLFRPIDGTFGYNGRLENIGSIENKGYEFALNGVIFEGDFSWRSNINMSFNENKILSLYNDEPINSGFASRIEVGQPLGAFYGWKWLGVDPETGDGIFEDVDGDGNTFLDEDDRVILGSAQPDFVGGFGNNFSFKGIELNIFAQFSYGNEIFNNNRQFNEGMNSVFNQRIDVLNRWKKPGDVTDMPRAVWGDPNQNRRDSDRYVEDGSFIRIKTATLAYNLPAGLLGNIGLNRLRVYVQSQNLFTFTNYSGFDPEVNTFNTSNTALGTDFLTYPQARTIMFGVNVGF